MHAMHALLPDFDTDGVTALRRDLHAHPELGFDEQRTSDRVAAWLQALGLPMHRGLARTGVVGIVHGRDGGAAAKNGRAIGPAFPRWFWGAPSWAGRDTRRTLS